MDYKTELVELRRAADQINGQLAGKGFLDPNNGRLKFPLVNYKALFDFNLESLTPEEVLGLKKQIILTEECLGNDKNVINVIYLLIRNLEEIQAVRNDQVEKLHEVDSALEALQRENEQLKKRILELERHNHDIKTKLAQEKYLNEQTRKENQGLEMELRKLGNTIKSMRTSRENERRLLEFELDELKAKKSLKSTIYINGSIKSPSQVDKSLAIDQEIEALMVDSLDLIANLTKANTRSLHVLQRVLDYCISIKEYLSSEVPLEWPVLTENTPKDTSLESLANVESLYNELQAEFESLFEVLSGKNDGTSAEIRQLKEELEIVRENWQRSLDLLREWERKNE